MYDLVLRRALITEDGAPADIAVIDGMIDAVGDVPPQAPARETIDCDGLVVVPGFIEPHLHLDKALLSGVGRPAETLADAIEVTGSSNATSPLTPSGHAPSRCSGGPSATAPH